MDGLPRRRGGATALVAKFYFNRKRAQIASSIRNGFSKRRTSDSDIEAQRLLSNDDDGKSPYLTAVMSGYRNFPCWTRMVLAAATWALTMNLLVILSSFHAWVTCLAGILSSAVAAAVFVAQLRLENLEGA
jgi:hypothetical protein